MKKVLSFLLLAFVCGCWASAQTVLYSDNFDSYTAGQNLCVQNSTAWTTWSNAPGSNEDAAISTEQANSGANSLKITGQNDIIYRFANQTTGVYDIQFMYYVPSSGQGAYFNLQHYYNPGIEWALECFLATSGSGYVTINDVNNNFTFPVNSWFPVAIHVDLDNVTAEMSINNTSVVTWNFSQTSSATAGVSQLGSVNFYAGAPNNAAGTYYVDDFVVTEVSAANDGVLVVESTPNTQDLVFDVAAGETETFVFDLSNPGGTPVNYRIVPTYNITPGAATQNPTTLAHTYTYDAGGIIVGSTSCEIAIGFTATEIKNQNLIGKTLNSITVYLENTYLMNNPKIRVYHMNGILVDGPGEVAYEQAFYPTDGLNTVTLNTPYVLDGSDLWFGFYFEQAEATTTADVRPVLGSDMATTPELNGNWIKNSVAWDHLNTNPELTYNWGLSGSVDGTAITPWIAASTTLQGTIAPNATIPHTFTFAAGEAQSVRNGKIYFFSNSLASECHTRNITVNAITVGIDENETIAINIYPNPATDQLNIAAENLCRVEIFSMNGQRIWDKQYAENAISIAANNWKAGTYIVKVTTQDATKIEKIVVGNK